MYFYRNRKYITVYSLCLSCIALFRKSMIYIVIIPCFILNIILLKEIVFPLHLLSCTNISCDNHIADIENIYYLIVNACIISTSITVQYQRKVTSSRNITPGWNRELDYARESSLFWKRMWIQCDKPISGVVHGLKCTTKTKYRHLLRSLKSKRNKYIKQSICQRVLRNNN